MSRPAGITKNLTIQFEVLLRIEALLGYNLRVDNALEYLIDTLEMRYE